jgi:hypothetical protein
MGVANLMESERSKMGLVSVFDDDDDAYVYETCQYYRMVHITFADRFQYSAANCHACLACSMNINMQAI